MRLRKIPRGFYLRPTRRVARELVGKYLVRRMGRTLLAGRIVEVEAYLGEKDPASHAYRGRTRRNEVMFRKGGCLYVYFTYGMHFCCNVVTESEGTARAVLLRALEPVNGIGFMRRSRSAGRRTASRPGIALSDLCSGPAKLCQAFAIGRRENGTDLCGNAIWIATGPSNAGMIPIAASPRIGIRDGKEFRWRYFIRGNPYVSRSRSPGKRPAT